MAVHTGTVPSMAKGWQWTIASDKWSCGQAAALRGAHIIRQAIAKRGSCNVVLATGASQFDLLEGLTNDASIDWSKVTCFHLDEYIGLSEQHPASFVGYLKERFLDKLTNKPAAFHFLDGTADPDKACRQLGNIIRSHKIDVAFIGFGENAHLGFNDPPADFESDAAFITVDLAESCRQQQLGEGWFDQLDDVPRQAITMTIHQITAAKHIICTVPEKRKARAVRDSLTGAVSPNVPATILQKHPYCYVFLDQDSASELPLFAGQPSQ